MFRIIDLVLVSNTAAERGQNKEGLPPSVVLSSHDRQEIASLFTRPGVKTLISFSVLETRQS